MSEAVIQTDVGPGQVISVQESYAPGWEVWGGGQQLQVRGDAIGQIVIDPFGRDEYDLGHHLSQRRIHP
jgi:hypothetical protein